MYKDNKLTKNELFWQTVLFWSIAIVAFEAPFSIVFKTKLQTWQVWVDGILSVIFLADFIYNFRSAKKNKTVVTKKISFYALMLVDILCIIPFDLISSTLELDSTLSFLKLIRLFRLIRIVKLFSLVGNFNVIPKSLKIVFGIVASLMAVHWIACGWICIQPTANNLDNYTIYNMAFYWAVTTLTTIGYGDITPTNNTARLFTMVIMVTGVGLYGVIIGNVSRMLTQADKYKEKSKQKL